MRAIALAWGFLLLSLCRNVWGVINASFPLSSDVDALFDLFESTTGSEWQWRPSTDLHGVPWNFTGYPNNMTSNPCSQEMPWQGIVCSDSCMVANSQNGIEVCRVIVVSLNNRNMAGPIPDSLWNLTALEYLDVWGNSLSGTIPHAIGSTMPGLTYLDLDTNAMYGTLPNSLTQLIYLEQLWLNSNAFSGTIPSQGWGNLTSLTALVLYENVLTGSIPESFSELTALQGIDIDDNLITGTIPESLSDLPTLLILYVFRCHLSGTIPESFGRASWLQSLAVSNNFLTGTIPSSLPNASFLHIINANDNLLWGTLPESLQTLTQLQALEFSSNLLTGSLSEWMFDGCMTDLQLIDASNNQFTGDFPWPDTASTNSLQIITIANNLLSASLPWQLFNSSQLQEFVASNNFFSGTLPRQEQTLASSSTMQLINFQVSNNSLSGSLSAAIFPDSVQVVYLDNNRFSGSLDSSYFALAKSLTVLALDINCFSGTIPTSLCECDHLLQLTMNGLRSGIGCQQLIFPFFQSSGVVSQLLAVSGTIPSCLLQLPELQVLHMSGNALTGSIPAYAINETLYPSHSKPLTDLVLSNNGLQFAVPSSVWRHNLTKLDLSFNRLRDVIPNGIGEGTQSSNESIAMKELDLQVNRLSGWIPQPLNLVQHIHILQGNMFSCDHFRSDLPAHDPNRANYSCGSQFTDVSLIVFAVLCFVLLAFVASKYIRHKNVSLEWWSAYDRAVAANAKAKTLNRVLELNRRGAFVTAVFAVVILFPYYAALQQFFSSAVHSYVWTVSALFLSGFPPSLGLLFAFALIIAIVAGLVPIDSTESSGPSDAQDEYADEKEEAAVEDHNAHAPKLASERVKELSAMAIYLIINTAVVVTLNGLFVNATVHGQYSEFQITVFSLLLSLFKLLWTKLHVSLQALKHAQSSLLPKRVVKYLDFLPFTWSEDALMWLSIFNNFFVPILAELFVSPNCFLFAVTEPPPVRTSYSLAACPVDEFCQFNETTLITTCELLLDCQQATASLSSASQVSSSFVPPFHYSYQCASSLLSTFAPVYIYRAVLGICGAIAMSIWSTEQFPQSFSKLASALTTKSSAVQSEKMSHHSVSTKARTVPDTASVSQKAISTIESISMDSLSYATIADSPPVAISVSAKRQLARSLSRNLVSFNFLSFLELIKGPELLLSLSINVTILISFGVLFPPLLCAVVLAMLLDIYQFKLLSGRQLVDAMSLGDELNFAADRSMRLGFHTKSSIEKMVRGFWRSVSLAACLWSWLLFDTLGDAVGALHAVWIVGIMLAFPAFAFFVKRAVHRRKTATSKYNHKHIFVVPVDELAMVSTDECEGV